MSFHGNGCDVIIHGYEKAESVRRICFGDRKSPYKNVLHYWLNGRLKCNSIKEYCKKFFFRDTLEKCFIMLEFTKNTIVTY